MEKDFLKGIVETLLFITDKPLSKEYLVELIDDSSVNVNILTDIIDELKIFYMNNSKIELREVAGGFQFATRPEYSEYVRRLYKERTALRLSPASLETLSIVAYKQPVTKAEIEETRGVDSTSAIDTLLEKKLIKIVGRKEVPGRPLLYATSKEFLKYFGINSLSDLPPLDEFIEQSQEKFKQEQESGA